MKHCPKCERKRPNKAFSRAKQSADGLQGWCKDCMRDYKREYQEEHGDNYHRLSRQRIRWDVLTHYSGDPPFCGCCGESYYEFLSIDHINGGGRQDRVINGWSRLYEQLKADGFPAGFRVLCHNCNQAIGHYGFCPHVHPERSLVARPADKRTMMNLASRQRVLAAGLQLAAQRAMPTLERLAAVTGLSVASVQRHRRFAKHDGTWQQVEEMYASS